MEKIANYEIIEEIESYGENLTLWLVEDVSGVELEALTIVSKKEFENQINRILKNEVYPFVKSEIKGIQQIVETGFDKKNNFHFIVYENTQEQFYPIKEFDKKNFLSLVETLNELKNNNRYGFILNKGGIIQNGENDILIKFIGLFEIFKLYEALDKDFLSPQLLENKKPRLQDDVFAIGILYSEFLSNNLEILDRCLTKDRVGRYKKYSELLFDIEKLETGSKHSKEIIKVVSNVSDNDFLEILQEMNTSCYWTIESKKSEQKNEITGQFSTENFSGRYFVGNQNQMFIPFPNHTGANDRVKNKGTIAPFNFSFENSVYNCVAFFETEFEKNNKLDSLYKKQTSILKKWQALPEKEKEFIEEKAFKATYLKREESKSNNQNIRFSLNEDFKDWGGVKELKGQKTVLCIDDAEIGEILDFNPSGNFLIIKDSNLSLEEIPKTGELVQDVRQETSQFKKQVEACKQFSKRDITNPDIAGILATPEKTPPFNRVDLDFEAFENEIISGYLKNDASQKEAVLEALYKKPVFLIQGPPGTGKTTVIVELVQQLVNKNSSCKILITSQSNLAVDNVLERLPEEILSMRLASREVVENENINQNVKAHLFENKLKYWIEKTKENSDKYFEKRFGSKSKNNILIDFYLAYSRMQKKNEKKLLGEFYNSLKFRPNYIKKQFGGVSSKNDIQKIFDKELGEDYRKLIQLKKEWFAFISNATSEGKSMLNNGSNEIDFSSAYALSMNVFGATCIHIASAKYSKFDLKFDYVIMDEASKASPAETLVPINMARNVILIGDHKQLPPVVTREEAIKNKVRNELDDNGLDFEKEFGESLFEGLITSFEANPSLQAYIKMLDIQYRMPRQLGTIISNHFYNGHLKNPDIRLKGLSDYDQKKFHHLKLKKPFVQITDKFSDSKIQVPSSVLFVTTSNRHNHNDNGNKFERKNQCNVDVIKEVLKELNERYSENSKKATPFDIGVIAGYRGQVDLLKEKIKYSEYSNFTIVDKDKTKSLIEINTVDKFQGAERDIIIYDVVRSDSGKSTIGFLQDYRRINVAFSRAKRLLIIVGDSDYILKRAMLFKDDKFKEFKLQNIVKELEEQELIFNSLKDAINA
ncbi:AAA domain-containing protein [Flavicella sediminum]|uniref:AAA domain-containing protein n=1 Tax=Flavicella sediminum TaxID=2585141 RepID=UPI001121B1B2|nr:AAA domain-containing protein [Flavicella sediminum]